MSPRTARRQGRPPLTWLDAFAVADLAIGTAISVEELGRHGPRIVGRITATDRDAIELDTPRGEVRMKINRIKRARIVPALYEPGDPVLLRHVPAAQWRGGVVRVAGTDVLVELIDGSFAWHGEADLEPAEARDSAISAAG